MLTIFAILVLVSIVLIITVGFMVQNQTIPLKDKDMGRSSNTPLIDVQSIQSGPVGQLVLSMGIILLFVGFGAIIVTLWVWRNKVPHNST